MSASFDPASLIRPAVATLQPYTPILPFEVLSARLGIPAADIIKLDANENPYGPSPRAVEAVAHFPHMHIYPDPESGQLRQALGEYTGLSPDYLLVGHGADELIDLLMRLFISPGDSIINCPPTFGMYPFDAAVNGARVVNVFRRADFSLNLPAIQAALERVPRPKLLFIATPNNPDGLPLAEATLQRLLKLPLVVILDEAYVEFCGHSFIRRVAEHPNLVVLRTFSKWAGLAGLRVGYGAFPPPIINQLWKIKQPYNVNVAGQAAALASLNDRAYLQQNVAKIIAARDAFAQELAHIPWLRPYPSRANFILARVAGKEAAAVKDALARQGILRHYRSARLQDHLRVSIGTPAHMARLLKGLHAL
ncbi:MAG: histidinol-phosphate transaminase [Anaerolineae bacterium]